MLLSVAAAVVTAPVLWFVGSLAGVAAVTLLQEVRVERQVRRIPAAAGVRRGISTIAVPVSGSGMTRPANPNTASTVSSVITSAGGPAATTRPPRIATRCVA